MNWRRTLAGFLVLGGVVALLAWLIIVMRVSPVEILGGERAACNETEVVVLLVDEGTRILAEALDPVATADAAKRWERWGRLAGPPEAVRDAAWATEGEVSLRVEMVRRCDERRIADYWTWWVSAEGVELDIGRAEQELGAD